MANVKASESSIVSLHSETHVVLYFGGIKRVRDLKKGDVLIGLNGEPVVVMKLNDDPSELYRIIPEYGDFFYLSKSSIVCLSNSLGDRLINLPIEDYMVKQTEMKHAYKLFSIPLEFEAQQTKNDPYLIGLIVGFEEPTSRDMERIIKEWLDAKLSNLFLYLHANKDATKRIIKGNLGCNNVDYDEIRSIVNSGYIPDEYLYGARSDRHKLLKGIIYAKNKMKPRFEAEDKKEAEVRLAAENRRSKSESRRKPQSALADRNKISKDMRQKVMVMSRRSKSQVNLHMPKKDLEGEAPRPPSRNLYEKFEQRRKSRRSEYEEQTMVYDLDDIEGSINKSGGGGKGSRIPVLKSQHIHFNICNNLLGEQIKFLVNSLGYKYAYVPPEMNIYGNIEVPIIPGKRLCRNFKVEKGGYGSCHSVVLSVGNHCVLSNCIMVHMG